MCRTVRSQRSTRRMKGELTASPLQQPSPHSALDAVTCLPPSRRLPCQLPCFPSNSSLARVTVRPTARVLSAAGKRELMLL